MKRAHAAVVLTLPVLLAGCGDDEDVKGGSGADTSMEPTSDAEAIEQTMTAFLLEPRCDLATEEYLVALSLDDENTPEEACEQWETLFIDPVYSADDIVYSDLTITGDVATVAVGSEHVNITTLYELTRVDGTWLISGDEYNSDDL